MAKGFSFACYLKKIPILLLCSVPLLAFIAFSSLSYGVADAYDEWRTLQVIILFLLGTYSLFMCTKSTVLAKKDNYFVKFGLPVLLILIVCSLVQAQHFERAAADAALYGLLAIGVWSQANLFRKNESIAPKIAALLAVLPTLTIIFLPINLVGIACGLENNEWHQLFSNVRMFDDALLPCMFLLWQRPAWLSINFSKNKLLNSMSSAIIWLISLIYFMGLWLDGARADLLSVLIGLALVGVLRRDQFIELRLPAFTLVGSGILYALLIHIFPNMASFTITRTDSSLRNELWSKALHLWQMHPIFGAGGDSFALSEPWRLNAHPHNILIQLISEWGFAGILAVCLLIPLAIQIFRNRKTLPAFAMAAVAAICVNASVSGALVYPLSQTLGLWSLAWLISLLPKQHAEVLQDNTLHGYTIKFQIKRSSSLFPWQLTFKVMAVLAITVMLSVHGRDIICSHCRSLDIENAPRFWQHGRALHLESTDIKVIEAH